VEHEDFLRAFEDLSFPPIAFTTGNTSTLPALLEIYRRIARRERMSRYRRFANHHGATQNTITRLHWLGCACSSPCETPRIRVRAVHHRSSQLKTQAFSPNIIRKNPADGRCPRSLVEPDLQPLPDLRFTAAADFFSSAFGQRFGSSVSRPRCTAQTISFSSITARCCFGFVIRAESFVHNHLYRTPRSSSACRSSNAFGSARAVVSPCLD